MKTFRSIINSTKYLFCALTVMVAVSSCEDGYDGLLTELGDKSIVTFSSSITSRATDTAFETGDEISVTAYDLSGDIYAENVKYIYTSSVFASTSPIKYADNVSTLSFRALYPYVEMSEDYKVSFSVKRDQSAGSNYTLSDLLYSYADTTSSNTPSLVFNHLMTKVVVSVTYEDIVVTSAKATLNAVADVEYDLATFSPKVKESAETITMANTGTTYFEAIVAPQFIAANDDFITVTVNGTAYPISYDAIQELESGKEFKCSLVINESSIVFSDSEINDWGTSSSGSVSGGAGSSSVSGIKSVVYVPEYIDGNATIEYKENSKLATLSYKITPESLAQELADEYSSALSVSAVSVMSRSSFNFIDMPIVGATAHEGILSVVVSGDALSDGYYMGDSMGYSVCMNVLQGGESVSSEFVNMVVSYPEIDADVVIGCSSALVSFRNRVNSGETTLSAVLINDIDLEGIEWTPIGTSGGRYAGSFDGNGYTISDFKVTNNGGSGLFGYAEGNCTIKNLTVKGAIINALEYDRIGALCGYFAGNAVESCIVDGGSVSGYYAVGGLIGFARADSYIANCYNTANVYGEENVGGIVGENFMSCIESCYNTASISGNIFVGGVVGYSQEGTIVACYNTASVSGDSNVCGVVGCSSFSTIKSCYNTGYVQGTTSSGGIVISSENEQPTEPTTVTSSYYLDIIGTSYTSVEYGESLTESVMKSTGFVMTLNAAGDNYFEYDSASVNGGYPILVGIDY